MAHRRACTEGIARFMIDCSRVAEVEMRVRSVLVSFVMVASVVITTATPVGAQTLLCNGLVATIVGTAGADVLTGTPGDDVIVSLGGNDRVFAGRGDDTVCTGPGNDFAKGQQGSDELFMGAGRDIAFGNAGGDFINGGPGNDVLWGGVGPDGILAGSGNDTIHAGHGNDIAFGGVGHDKLNGSTGADDLNGGQGDDTITGGKGFDDLFGDPGNDLITGGPGDDFLNGGFGGDRCRTDIHDSFVNCQGGNVSGGSGNGDGDLVPILSPEFVLPSPDGPSYVLHIDAIPFTGQLLTVTVKDANGGLLFEGGGFDPVFSNLLIAGGVPALVEITGADVWTAAFLKPVILKDDLIFAADQGSQIFGVAPSLDGFSQALTVNAKNNGNNNSIFQLVSVGDDGVILEVNDTLTPGEEKTFTGGLRAGATWVAILAAPTVTWDFTLDDG